MTENLHLDQWQTLVESHPESTPFHHRSWIELLMTQYGFGCSVPAIKKNGTIAAAIPFLETRGLLGARKLISLPFTDCLVPLTRDSQSLETLCASVQTEIAADYQSVVVRTNTPIPGMSAGCDWVRHEVPPSGLREMSFDKLPSSLRRNLRRARKNKLEYEQRTDPQAMAEFFRLHTATRKKLGVPVQPKSYFRRLHEYIVQRGLGFVGVVTHEKVPIAAAVFLTYNGTMIYKYGASDPRALDHRPNDFLFFNVLQFASQQEFERFDFGVTAKEDTGLRQFKKKWGGQEEQVYHVYVAGHVDKSKHRSLALRLTSVAIRQSPPIVCRALGSALYRYSQ